MKKIFFGLIILISFQNNIKAQNTRITDNNNIAWFTYTGTFKLDDKFSIHTEYQLRRDEFISHWQQSLIRTGLNYNLNPKVVARLGYANIETFDYGDYPINGIGKQFTEHRVYEVATINDQINIFEISHRFMLEQRWLGKYSSAQLDKEDQWSYVNRIRYMYRMQIPLKGKIIKNNTPYAVIYDEILLGFGENVNENIFDQNRLAILAGYKFSPMVKIEGGFFSQIIQLGREIDTKNVYQYNNGFIISTIFNFDLSKKNI